MDIKLQNIMPEPLASIQHGDKSIWGNDILLKSGNKIMLNAASGKGKSTFTFTTVGLRKDYTGNLLYGDRDIRTFTPDDWAEIRTSKIAVVFQDLQLFPSLTVRENLNLKNGLTNTFTEDELFMQLSELGLENKWNQSCGLLSMGQQQRVAIIRALAQPFEWLIMDEPFSHLDVENTQICLNMINNRANKIGAGFVLTTLGESYDFNYDYTLNL